MRNIDKVVEYILKNAGRLTPEKITALSDVVGKLEEKDPVKSEPNKLEGEENDYLSEASPMNLADIENIQIDSNKSIKTKIYK